MTDSDVQRIADSLGKAEQIKDYWRCLCPVHNDTKPSLDLKQDNGKFLYKCRAGCSQDEVGKELKRRFPEAFKKDYQHSYHHQNKKKEKLGKADYVRKLWGEAINPQDTPVETYLKKRIPTLDRDKIPQCLQYLPKAWHSETKKNFRGLVASFTLFPAHNVESIKIIYLTEDGTDKAPVDPQKRTIGQVQGKAIVIDPPTERLIVAEGVESALAVREIVKGLIPVWSADTATNLANLQLPPKPTASELIIACDYDEAGLKGALKLAMRAKKEGRQVNIIRPASPHTDFNDVFLDALSKQSDMSLEALSEPVNEEEELKRLGLNQKDLEKENTAEDYQDALEGLDDDVAIARHLFRRLQKDYGEIQYSEGELYVYPKKATHWHVLHDEHLKRKIQAYSGRKNITLKGTIEFIKLTKSRIESILANLYDFKKVPAKQDIFFRDKNRIHGINCLDGFIKIDEKGYELLPHDREHRQRFTVPFRLNKGLLDCYQINWAVPEWDRSLIHKLLSGTFLDDTDKWEKIRLICQILGVTASRFSTKMKQPTAFFFLGESANNGKSQFLFLLKNFLPEDDVVSVDPEQFGDKHERIRLKNKSLNIASDIMGGGIESSDYKKLITADWTNGRHLYHDSVDFQCEALHVFAGNKAPSSFLKGIDEGVKRRTAFVKFNRVIPPEEIIIDIAQKIIAVEGDKLLALAVAGLIDIEKNKRNYSFPSSSEEAMKQWQSQADAVIGFSDACIQFEEGLPFVSSQFIYEQFLEWCRKEGRDQYTKLSKISFVMRLQTNLPKGIILKHTKSGNGYLNLKLINVSEHHIEQPNVVPFSKYGSHKWGM